MLRVDPRNAKAVDLSERLAGMVDLTQLPGRPCVVIGGDGFLLAAMRELGPGVPYLGINAGHLGFLLNDPPRDDPGLLRFAQALASGGFDAWPFPRLSLRAQGTDGQEVRAAAVNDLYLERATGQTAHLRVWLDGEQVVDRLVCDGLLVATALGSTAYTYSAGGVPCDPRVRAVQVTAIAPHAPRLSPIVVPIGTRVEVEALSPEKRPVRAVADGVDLGPVRGMEAGPSEEDVQLCFLREHRFTRALLRKVLRT